MGADAFSQKEEDEDNGGIGKTYWNKDGTAPRYLADLQKIANNVIFPQDEEVTEDDAKELKKQLKKLQKEKAEEKKKNEGWSSWLMGKVSSLYGAENKDEKAYSYGDSRVL